MIRVLHFSDVHLEDGFRGVPIAEFLSKRLVGWANLRLARGAHFRDARAKVGELAELARRERIDLALCTGDYTAIGTDPELAFARSVMEPFHHLPLGLVTVPGNHDHYVEDAVLDGRFARHFGDALRSDRPDFAVDGPFPVVRFPSDGIAVVAIDSARANRAPHLSSGRVPDAQLDALRLIAEDPDVRARFVFVITHYAPRLESGLPDRPMHGLENADELLAILARLPFAALLHGHVHRRYHVRDPALSFPLFCAGSATHEGREGAWIYEADRERVRAIPLHYDGGYRVEHDAAITLSRGR